MTITSNARLTDLSAIIASETAKIQDFFAQNGLPDLSFDPSAPLDFPVSPANSDIQASRRKVINATQELHDLMVGPSQSMRWLGWSVRRVSPFFFIVRRRQWNRYRLTSPVQRQPESQCRIPFQLCPSRAPRPPRIL